MPPRGFFFLAAASAWVRGRLWMTACAGADRSRDDTRPLYFRWPQVLLALLVVATTVSLTGCGGCRDTTDPKQRAEEARKKLEEQRKKKKKKPKPDFEIDNLLPLPQDDRPVQRLKPGHWLTARQAMRVNNFDFHGQVSWTPIDAQSGRVPLDRTGYQLTMTRPLFLAKKQQDKKQVEMTLFAPVSGKRTRFAETLEGTRRLSRIETFYHLEPHEYYLVVLAREPVRYRIWNELDSMRVRPPPGQTIDNEGSVTYYHVLLPKIERRAPLPDSLLTATSTAYILWDDVEPSRLSDQQQTALIDWLHWGGQLLISGPESLDLLQGSFLEPYLPATGGAARELVSDDFQRINGDWTEPFPALRNRPLTAIRPWSAVALEVNDVVGVRVLARTPQEIPLVVERPVGRGRVVVTAFRLRQRDLINWPGFDGFANACLLRRAPREFSRSGEFGEFHANWVDPASGAVRPDARLDPRRVTGLRLFTRDAGYAYQPPPPQLDAPGGFTAEVDLDAPTPAGLGSWNDFNDVSNAARATIRKAAGIEIPDATFVAGVLAAYLVVLIPLNWIVFRLIGRIEWAWVTAPAIAVACAGVVIKLAQLDIGFARSNTEVSIVELYGGHPRAHVTRFTALYTSLSTPYDLAFDDAAAVVQPFAVERNFVQSYGEAPSDVHYTRETRVTMTGFQVDSNRTGLIHSEQMMDLGGGLVLEEADGDRPVVRNGTAMDLTRAAVVRGRGDGGYELAWLGDLPAGGSAYGVYQAEEFERLLPTWRDAGRTAAAARSRLDLDPLMKVALADSELGAGDVRLVAQQFQQRLPGLEVRPAAPQQRPATVIVAHLRFGRRVEPQPDRNCRRDFYPEPTRARDPEDERN